MRSLRLKLLLLKSDTSRSLINGTRSAEEGRDVLKLQKALMGDMCCQNIPNKRGETPGAGFCLHVSMVIFNLSKRTEHSFHMKTKISLLYSLILLGSFLVIRVQLFAEEKNEIIQKSTPTGIWCLLPSYGYKHPRQINRLNNTPCWANSNVDGIVLRADWDKIEPTEGKIDFSYFDRGLELAKKYNKRIEILVPAGKHSPQWVYAAGADKFYFHHRNGKPADYMPIPWYPVLQEKFGNLIKKLGERYDSSPYLSYVIMTGFGHSTETWFAGPDDMDEYNAIGGNAKWIEGAKWFAALYNKAFPTTPFLIAMCPPSRDDEGRATLKKFVEDSVKDYPHRFGLKAASLEPNDKPNSHKLSYQSVNRFSDQTITGFEMLLATKKLKGTLKEALDTAIVLKAQFVEIYEPDLIDPKQQEVLAEAGDKLKKNLTWNKRNL
jgi:hypothetical protein